MSATLLDKLKPLASVYGNAGICPDDTQAISNILDDLNEGLELLMKRLDAVGTLTHMTVPVYDSTFFLPPEIIQVRQAFYNGCEVTLRDRWYEGTLGAKIECSGRMCKGPDLISENDGYPAPFEWPNYHFDTRIGLVAEHEGDAGQEVQVRFRNRVGDEVEEFITLLDSQQMAQSQDVCLGLKLFRKPLTKGVVRLHVAYNNGTQTLRARYQPRITTASYRKMRLPWAGCNGELEIIGKARFLNLTSENDPLPITDSAALKWVIKAVQRQRNDDDAGYNQALTFAVNELQKAQSNEQSAGVVSQMRITSPFGRAPGRRCWH